MRMLKFDASDWKYFSIKELFSFEKGKYLSLVDKNNCIGTIPCINGSSLDNGLLTFLDKSIEEKGFKLQKAPSLSLSRVGNAGLTFVQPQDFYIADNAYSLRLKDVDGNIFIYLFISTVLNLEITKYSYGRIINSKYFDTKIKLPSDAKGYPDWNFMEKFIKERYKTIEQKTITKIKTKPEALDISTWKQFKVSDLFNVKGTRTTKLDDLELAGSGMYPYVTTQSIDNGVAGYYSIYTEEGNAITADSAVVGFCSYQEKPFSASDHVEKLIPKFKMNRFNALFIVTMLNKENYRYSYGRKFNQAKINDTIIKLPADFQGNPDWQFMENYIKSLPYGDLI